MNDATTSAKNKNSRAAIAVATTTSTAQERVLLCQLATYEDGAGHAGTGRIVRFECVWEKKLEYIFVFCICSTLSCLYDELSVEDHMIKVLFFGHQTNYI